MNLVNSVVLFMYLGINGERWFSFHIQRIKQSLTRSDIFDYLLLKVSLIYPPQQRAAVLLYHDSNLLIELIYNN